jgi:hypothetical protein
MTPPKNTQRRFTPFLSASDYPQELIDNLLPHVPTPLMAQLDMPRALRALLASIALGLESKVHVLESFPLLMQWQCDALLEVWEDEQREMARVAREEWPVISALCAQAWRNAVLLCDHFGAPISAGQSRLWLGHLLRAKFATTPRRAWLEQALLANPGPSVCGAWSLAAPELCDAAHHLWWLPAPESLQ